MSLCIPVSLCIPPIHSEFVNVLSLSPERTDSSLQKESSINKPFSSRGARGGEEELDHSFRAVEEMNQRTLAADAALVLNHNSKNNRFQSRYA